MVGYTQKDCMSEHIIIKGACEHNLKNVSLNIPRDSMVVITGVSGSGKSSLAFDTIFQEGQRKYVESLSAYARQFIGSMKSPRVESIQGISPTISIDQKTINRNPRSTVGTVTEILDHLRLLYSRLGTPSCPKCGDPIQAQTVDQIVDGLLSEWEGKVIHIMAPVIQERKGEYRKELKEFMEMGYVRARIDGEVRRLDEEIVLNRYEKHTIEPVIDRLPVQKKLQSRLREAVEMAVKLADHVVSIQIFDELDTAQTVSEAPIAPSQKPAGKSLKKRVGQSANGEYRVLSTQMGCAKCRIGFPEIEPRLFSFNVSQGECPHCNGIGKSYEFDVNLVIPDPSLSINQGALKPQQPAGNISFSKLGTQEFEILAEQYDFDLDTPWEQLSPQAQQTILWGSPDVFSYYLEKKSRRRGRSKVKKITRRISGVMQELQKAWDKWHVSLLQKYMQESVCAVCQGTRLNPFALAVHFYKKNIHDLTVMSIEDLHAFFSTLKLSPKETRIGHELFKEIRNRLGFLLNVGLGYLSLDRSAGTLSGGEAQRIRLAAQVGAGLQGVLYILDEPSIGLHPKDNERLLNTLQQLRDNGNSLLVVEHDEDTMRRADTIIDIGPGAGSKGGELLAQGRWNTLLRNPNSLTGAYLSGKKQIAIPEQRRTITQQALSIQGARHNNLQNIDVDFPLGVMVAVTGASGSGKSSLVNGILKKALAKRFHGSLEEAGEHDSITGFEHIDKVIEIDQSPIGRTPRSNPATYTKLFDPIRDLFSSLPESKLRGYPKGRFSFNVKGGRCEECEGAGVKVINMQILSDVQVTCEACNGKRFNQSTLEIHFKGKTISDVLDMTVHQALEFFQDHPKINTTLQVLADIGLDYIHLGQPSTTLSGGEAQRIKLASELRRPATGRTLYLLDEPTTGLHFEDINKLLACLQSLVNKGNSVIVIEHNLDVVKCADWVIDLGPDGGKYGGELVAFGTPEQVAANSRSYTGSFLQPVLQGTHLQAGQARKFKKNRSTQHSGTRWS
jgi:excinuclease ABC subunit A